MPTPASEFHINVIYQFLKKVQFLKIIHCFKGLIPNAFKVVHINKIKSLHEFMGKKKSILTKSEITLN